MDFSADLIDERVWLGSLDSTRNTVALYHLHVTHILTLLEPEIEIDDNVNVVRKHVAVADVETTDLLVQFESCYEFIDQALSSDPKNNVLIHCHAGVSRSATIACMWLMRRYQLSAKAALERLTRARPVVRPNLSFSAQLFLFEQMNHRLDVDHQLYRDFQFELARSMYLDYDTENKGVEGKNHLRQRFRQAFTLPYGHASCTVVERYCCRQCQQDLFSNADLSKHSKGSGLYDWFKKYGSYNSNNLPYDLEDCQQIFTHCLEWLLDQIDTAANAHDGAIQCPKCSTVLGNYGLNGSKCACGRWVAPAFRFDEEKIERHDVTKIEIETINPSS